MKKLYSRHLEASLDGEHWTFAGFFRNMYCYKEEIPDLQEVEIATNYEEVMELVKEWKLDHKEKKNLFTRKNYVKIKLLFTDFCTSDRLYIRVKYNDESNATMSDLMKNLSNQDFKAWAEDNNLKYFEEKVLTK